MSGICELGRGLLRREQGAIEAEVGCFEKLAPNARAASLDAYETLGPQALAGVR